MPDDQSHEQSIQQDVEARTAHAQLLKRPLDELPDPLPMRPLTCQFNIDVTPPGSKSITNRALLLAAIADGQSTLRRPLTEAEDVERMIAALTALGAQVELRGDIPGEAVEPAMRITGAGGKLTGAAQLNLANAGTATRFLAAAALLAQGPTIIDGGPRMRSRPISELTTALTSLGATIEHLADPNCPPVRITPPDRASLGDTVTFGTTASSQFISALLLIAPWMPRGLRIIIEGEVTSPAYIVMTLELLRRLGAKDVSATKDLRTLTVGPGPIEPFDLEIEPDASGATYFWAAAAMAKRSSCRIMRLTKTSIQGDARFPSLLAAMGAVTGDSQNHIGVASPPGASSGLSGIKVDLSTMPDAAMTLAAAAWAAQGATLMSGLRTLRVKETDRVAALVAELTKAGASCEVREHADDLALEITPPSSTQKTEPIEFDTYDDHRMAMSLALIGLHRPGVSIRDPRCVRKTYPGFWADLSLLYAC